MNTFELFNESKKRKGQNGRRKFKAVLYEIYPEDCIDTENEVGTKFNRNGITFIEKYCEAALPSIEGMSLRCEFMDDERREICGHGMTDVEDGVPIFENATVIGTFTKGYIDDVELPNGETIRACIGEGEIDSSCYHNLCENLDADIKQGFYPDGSVEIMRTEENSAIKYLYGYKDEGRIPTEFIHSGYAIIGITPSDKNAKLVELNEKNKEENTHMNEADIKALVEKTVEAFLNKKAEIEAAQNDCQKKIDEMNEAVASANADKDSALSEIEKIKAALVACEAEREQAYKDLDALRDEESALRQELGELKAKSRVAKMNAEIERFSDEQKAYAKEEIEAFNANPMEVEINTIVDKILRGIGEKAMETATVVETNAANNVEIEDIFGAIEDKSNSEDVSIF